MAKRLTVEELAARQAKQLEDFKRKQAEAEAKKAGKRLKREAKAKKELFIAFLERHKLLIQTGDHGVDLVYAPEGPSGLCYIVDALAQYADWPYGRLPILAADEPAEGESSLEHEIPE